jgi:erythromycin esterase-like protein
VLLGEASHGTAEFYDWRRRISERLIRDHGFSFIAVEGDWPDCYRVNRYVKGVRDTHRNARDVLHAFNRWPTWMWANEEIVTLAEWLRQHNDSLPEERKAGFYGLDVYSLWDSMHAVLGYLEKSDGRAAAAARQAFQCFEPFGEDVQRYARATSWAPASCEQEVVKLLSELRRNAPHDDHAGSEAFFNAEQNALVAKNAEHYYRTMIRGDASSWNVRDRHMVETLDRLMDHYGPGAKAIVWEHNTHIGDARYTDMAADGMVNVGQLVREQHTREGVQLVGFSSHRGTVIAGGEWGAPMQMMRVPPARDGSWEALLHEAGASDKLLLFDGTGEDFVLDAGGPLAEERGHRAIGVVYHPEYEHYGNYVPTVLPLRYDALLYFDHSEALHPLHMHNKQEHELPETYPTGL